VLFDLRQYSHDELIRGLFADSVKGVQSAHPQNIALKRIRAGEKSYLVARDLGIANSTVYRWWNLSVAAG
jgi:DNA invertase Pin-like site-specific DNA recombinase